MRLHSSILAATVGSALLCGAASAQTHLQKSDIVAAANGVVGVLDADGASSESFDSASSVTTILWDPNRPDEYICGGGSASFSNSGYLVRQVFTAPDQMTTTTLADTGSFALPVQMSWDQTGERVILVTAFDQVHSVHATTGDVIDLTTGAQPWGNQVSCGAMNPQTGDVFVGTSSGDLWRLASGGGPATLYASGLGSLKRILFDSVSGPQYVHFASAARFGRIALGGPAVPEYYFGVLGTPSFSGIVTATIDEHGDFLLATSGSNVYALPYTANLPLAGVAPTSVGQIAFDAPSFEYILDLAVAGATSTAFRLTVESVPVLGASVQMQGFPQPLGFGYLLISQSTFLPADSGPFFGLMPDALTLSILTTAPTPGGLLAFTGPGSPGFVIPQLGMLAFAGQTWDLVTVAFSPTAQLVGRTNLERVTWN